MSQIDENQAKYEGCLHNMTAVVTGASKGLGKAFALALAGAGANISIACRHKEDLDAIVSEAKELGVEVIAFGADITDENEIKSFVEQTIKHFDKIDICVNNAADGRINTSPEETSIEDRHRHKYYRYVYSC